MYIEIATAGPTEIYHKKIHNVRLIFFIRIILVEELDKLGIYQHNNGDWNERKGVETIDNSIELWLQTLYVVFTSQSGHYISIIWV